jgi:hypothetical protein
MPLVRIALVAGKPESHKQKVSDAVHRALVETISIPAQDRGDLNDDQIIGAVDIQVFRIIDKIGVGVLGDDVEACRPNTISCE